MPVLRGLSFTRPFLPAPLSLQAWAGIQGSGLRVWGLIFLGIWGFGAEPDSAEFYGLQLQNPRDVSLVWAFWLEGIGRLVGLPVPIARKL